MDIILSQLKSISKVPPKAWNFSVEITKKIIKQNDEFSNMQNNYHQFKEKQRIAKKIKNKNYVENCVKENEKRITELENLVVELKHQLQFILKEKNYIQKKIEENEKKKEESEKKNDKLLSKIENMKNQIVQIESSIQQLNSQIGEKNDFIESLDNTMQAVLRISRLIEQMVNKTKKVNFPAISCESDNLSVKSMERIETTPRFLTKSKIANQQAQPIKSLGRSSLPINIKYMPKISTSADSRETMPVLPNGCITSIAFTNSGKIFATGSEDYIICLYEYGQGYPFESIKIDRSIVSLDFNSSDSLLLVACYDTVRIFDFINYSLHAKPDKVVIDKIIHAEFISPDKFAVCSENFAPTVYKVNKKGSRLKATLRYKIPSVNTWICSATISSDFAAGYETGTIRIWDPQSSNVVFENGAHQSSVLQILCNGSTFVSLSQDGCVVFTNMLSRVIEKKIYLRGCPLHAKTKMAIFGKSLLIGSDDGFIHEFSLYNGKFISKWEKFHEAPITAIGANKSYVVSGDRNGKIKVWIERSSEQK